MGGCKIPLRGCVLFIEMRKLRYLPEESLVEVTVRTVHGRYLLRPSPKLRDRIVGILARAQRSTGMRVCGFVYLSNHAHLLLRPTDVEQMSRFMAYVNSNIAREAGRLHNWRQRFWGRRYTDIVVSREPEKHEERLRYLLSQGVKERLVASPRHWPGATSTQALMHGDSVEGEWMDRSASYRASRYGRQARPGRFLSRHRLELTPIPSWEHLERGERCKRVRRLVREIETEHERTGRPVLGRRAILAQDPHDCPEDFESTPAPRFHATSRSVRRALEDGYRWFVLEYRRASKDFRTGEPTSFPDGCFRPVSYQPARAAPD